MAGMTRRVSYALGRALGCGAVRIPVSELFPQGILASAAKDVPVLVSALVFLLKTSPVVLLSAAPPAQGRAVCVTKPLSKFHHDFSVLTAIRSKAGPARLSSQPERLSSWPCLRLLCSK